MSSDKEIRVKNFSFESLKDGASFLEIDLSGGLIALLTLDRKTILSYAVRGDGKTVATHPCTPNFGPDGRGVDESDKLPQHGPGRNSIWKKVESDDSSELRIRLEIDGEQYPEFKGLVVEQAFRLDSDELTIETTHFNNGSEEMPVNFGEHFYFNALVSGWKDLHINGAPMADNVKNTGVIDLKKENIISGLDVGEITLKQEGFSRGVLWTGKNKETGEYDKLYVCFEPVEGDPVDGDDPGFFGTEESMIEPNQSRKTVIKLSLDN